jgi:DNA-binding transcriptional LysR family regulator
MAVGSIETVKLSQLKALVAVAEQGNFSEAALQLQISQSAISHAIAALEEELGVVLLVRGRRGARLTPVGELITNHAREMLGLLELIGKEANLAKGLDGGKLRIATFRSVATHVLPDAIARFRCCFPGVNVTIQEYRGDDGVEQALRDGRAEIGFTCMQPAEEFEAWDVLMDEYVVLMPPALERPAPSLTWDELAQLPMIWPPSDDYCGILIRTHLNKLGVHLQTAYEIQEDSTIVGMVRKGLGFTIMARLAAEPLPSDIQVYPLPDPLERNIRTIILANALHPPTVFAFLDTLKEMYFRPMMKRSE